MFALLLFAALQAVQEPAVIEVRHLPQLRNPQAVITYEDYPQESMRRSEYGIVSVLLRVTTEGRVASCVITETSGSAVLDAKTCSLLKSRERFSPAINVAGSALESEVRMANSWGIGEHQPKTTMDVALQVATVPSDYKLPLKARLVFDAVGRISSCEITTTGGSGPADRAACAYVKQQITIAPPKNGSSEVPAAAVRYLTLSMSAYVPGSEARK